MEKIQQILQLKQFIHTPNSLLKVKEKEMNNYLRQLHKENIITKQLFRQLSSNCSSLSCMYGQPKMHKQGYPLRPIISPIGSYNYELSKYLANLLKNNRTTKPNSSIRDPFDLVRKIKNINCNKNLIMCTFDVDALYTNVPAKEAIEIAVKDMIKSKTINNTPFNEIQLKRLLEIAVHNIPFRFMNDNFLQTDGVAMGSPLEPILADIFMTNLEKKLNRFSKNKPKVWYRYVDDIFCIFNSEQNITNVLEKKELKQLKLILKTNGYPDHIIRRGIREGAIIANKIIKKQQQQQQQQLLDNNNNNNNKTSPTPIKKKISLTVSYYGQESIILSGKTKKICKKLIPHIDVNVAFKKHLH
ncbi:unnamed protein product [Rotaria magnacalcarata]|uniref:Reverse transcriptase domain-containing protein n=2 Tax=Rotaria magnacalcarata TaxID=392030 RepID=A0A815F084_9BILA|nr:unnamed protein product [Rotaria magnacalcarata]CAF1321768.1 unnamed protein product [Rotaria magnacalcarata]CAF2105049.1 unnamed protein product [Rotaria magnacalcarata]CAF3974292.1 unnamed protein product [Rotaria magnacalcarata]CAF3981648.1 unnamed protein product [Rotaria magnacalcarata]